MRALLSVTDKTGITAFAQGLAELNWELIASVSTGAALRQESVPYRPVEDLTGLPEMLGGRVKTLHPAIHGGILANRDDPAHMAEIERFGLSTIDLVVVNLYAFFEAARSSDGDERIMEHIDIGGVALIRAAAKNYRNVAILTAPDQYGWVLEALRSNGMLSTETRQQLAARAYELTATYDANVALYFRRQLGEPFPPALVLPLKKRQQLRYGENPHQQAALYIQETFESSTSERADLASAQQLRGKELSFTNLLDAEAAVSIAEEFQAPTVVLIKHTNPCGIATHTDLAEAFRRAYASDSLAAYGCVMATNRPIDEETAGEMRRRFMDIILAPDYTDVAFAILDRKSKDFRILKLPIRHGPPRGVAPQERSWIPANELDVRRIHGGMLAQTPDTLTEEDIQFSPVTKRHPTLEELADLFFAWKATRHVKSNSVVIAKNLATVGIAAGQQSRILAVEIAAKLAGDRAKGAVLATDGFFPFADGIEASARAGVTAIVHPGGGMREQEGIDAADAHGVAMVTTGGLRYFKH